MNTSQPVVIVRPVHEDDAEAIWQISRQEGVMETVLTLPSDRLEQRRAVLRELGPDSHWFVAVAEREVVGLAGLDVGRGRLRHSGHVFLFVARAWQGRGIGTRLLRTLLDLADDWLLLRRVELTVIADNDRAKRLYEQMGFEIEGLRKMSVIAQGRLKDEYLMARYR
ncbi:MAG TPA: GNAT family N-acetyltransferase [Ktedonobacterales bacterium]|nr:GNAT family N-acetyltransferase [Ktedonobacterales bacterium]